MIIKITKVVEKSPMPPQNAGEPGSIAWRMFADQEDGKPVAIWVRSEDSERGRQYAEGQDWEVSYTGKDINDKQPREGCESWKQARLNKPGYGGGGGRSSRSSGSTGGGGAQGASRPAAASGGFSGRSRLEMPRDEFQRRFWVLYFENATKGMEQLAAWKADERFINIEVDHRSFWEQVGKVTNQQAMSMGLESLPFTMDQQAQIEAALTGKKAEEDEAARKEREEKEAAEKAKKEKEAQEELERQQGAKATALNW